MEINRKGFFYRSLTSMLAFKVVYGSGPFKKRKQWKDIQVDETLGVCVLFWQYIGLVLRTLILCLVYTLVSTIAGILFAVCGLLVGLRPAINKEAEIWQMSRKEKLFFSVPLWIWYFTLKRIEMSLIPIYILDTTVATVLLGLFGHWLFTSESRGATSILFALGALCSAVAVIAGIFGGIWCLEHTTFGKMATEVWKSFWTKACPVPTYVDGNQTQ